MGTVESRLTPDMIEAGAAYLRDSMKTYPPYVAVYFDGPALARDLYLAMQAVAPAPPLREAGMVRELVPIETAPKDGTEIVVTAARWWTPLNGNNRWMFSPEQRTTWDGVRFQNGPYAPPTHWMRASVYPQLPAPPHYQKEQRNER